MTGRRSRCWVQRQASTSGRVSGGNSVQIPVPITAVSSVGSIGSVLVSLSLPEPAWLQQAEVPCKLYDTYALFCPANSSCSMLEFTNRVSE